MAPFSLKKIASCFGRTCSDLWKLKYYISYYFCSEPRLHRCQEHPDSKTAAGREDMGACTLMVVSESWMLTWIEPQRGVAGHQSGLGRLAAQVRRGARCALGTLALHWRNSLVRRTGRMRNSQVWGAVHGPAARWHSALDLVFGFPCWAAPPSWQHCPWHGGCSPGIQPHWSWALGSQPWNTKSWSLCLTQPAFRFSLPFSQQRLAPAWAWCIETEIQSLPQSPELAHIFLPAAVSSLLCTLQSFRLWTPDSGCPWYLSHHGPLRFLGSV